MTFPARGTTPSRDGRWYDRFTALKEQGFTREQADTVFELLDSVSAFGSRTMAEIARSKLERVYDQS